MGNTAQVAAAVESGTAELGFVEGAVETEHFTSTLVARDQLVVVVAPDHPWVGRARLNAPSDPMKGEWVLREPGSGTRSVFEDAWRTGVYPGALRIQLELPSNEAVRAAVAAGLGATAISASVAAPSIEADLLYPVAFSSSPGTRVPGLAIGSDIKAVPPRRSYRSLLVDLRRRKGPG